MLTRLTDEQIWAILTAPDELNARQLADQLGLTYSAVYNRRWRLRKHGWSCQVHWESCPECGKPLIERRRRQLYHDQCRLAVSRRLNALYEQDRLYTHFEYAQSTTRPPTKNYIRRHTAEDDKTLDRARERNCA